MYMYFNEYGQALFHVFFSQNSSLQTDLTEMRMKKIHGDSSDRARIIHGYKAQNDLLKVLMDILKV